MRQLSSTSKDGVKILAIFGYQADVESQGQAIQNLEKNVEVTWLKQPKREDLDEPLWKQRWDIIFFVGHGESQDEWKTGTIWINETDKITISELRNHLKKAIENGLKLAILNCCDGLGLAHSLAEGEDLYLPQMIVMREELPVAVAPRFLQYFLEEFTQYNSLYASVREARRRLQILEKEFPCASNLPVICQNPAVKPLRWNDLVIPACPYRGLSAFQEEDAELFFGRESFTNQLVKVVEDKKLVAVIGASGSGKSSVVLAGLIPRLRQKENWLIASLRPGATPFENLAKALLLPEQLATELQEGIRSFPDVIKTIGESRTVLLFVDQFEEIYSYPNQKFLNCLLEAVRDVSAFRLVITLRADFLGQAIEYNPLREQLQRWKPEFIGAMERQQLPAVIEEPAKKRGVYLEAGLKDHILNDIGNEPGYLPLLEFALTEMWDKQENGRLTRKVYDDIGGVKNALRRHAERVYDELEKADRERVKRIFLLLVSPGEGTEYIRRMATRAEVGEANWDFVTRLATARLVVSNRNETTEIETVEIVHEALIKAWPDLQKWIEENDVFLRWKKRLQAALKEWEKNENKEGYLLQVAPLGEAEGYLQQRLGDISPAERVFIQLGLGLRDRQRRRTILSLTSGLVAVSIFATGAVWQWQRAERQRLITETEGLAISALRQFESGGGDIASLLSAIESGQKLKHLVKDRPLYDYPTVAPLYALQKILDNLYEKNQLKAFFFGSLYGISRAKFTPDGKQIFTTDEGGNLQLWELPGTQIALYRNQIALNVNQKGDGKRTFMNDTDIVISPDGHKVAFIERNGTIKFLNSSGKLLNLQKLDISDNQKIFINSAISPDLRYVAATLINGETYLWKISGEKIATLNRPEQTNKSSQRQLKRSIAKDPVSTLSFSPDGKSIVTAVIADRNVICFWNLSGQLTHSFPASDRLIRSISFSPDGKKIATSSEDGTTIIWTILGKKITQFNSEQGVVNKISFSPDGQTIATASNNGTVQIWNLSGQKKHQLNGHQGAVNDVNFSPDGDQVITAGADGTLRIWTLNRQTQVIQFKTTNTNIRTVLFSPSGREIVTSGTDQIARFWNTSGEQIRQFTSGEYHKNSFLTLSEGGQYFITIDSLLKDKNDSSTLKLWDFSGQKKRELNGKFSWYSQSLLQGVVYSRDGQRLITLGDDQIFTLWDFSKEQIIRLKKIQFGLNLDFSPNGQYIVNVTAKGAVQLWNTSGIKIREWGGIQTQNSEQIQTETFYGIGTTFILDEQTRTPAVAGILENSPAQKSNIKEGDRILKVNGRSTVGMTLEEVSNLIRGPVDTKVTVKIARQGREEFEITLTRSMIKIPLTKNNEQVYRTAFFSSNGQRIATTGFVDNTVRLWDLFGKPIAKLEGHRSIVGGVLFSPNDQFIATVGLDNTVRLWKASGTPLAELKGYQGKLTNLSFSPNNQLVATAGDDGKIRLWSLSGQQVGQLEGSKGQVVSMSFSPDGKSIVAGWADGVVMVWRVQGLNELLARACNWLKEYSASYPAVRAELKNCEDKSVLIEAGRDLARMGDVPGAIVKFQDALKLDPQLKVNPEIEARLLAAPAKLRQGKEMVIKGQIKQAIEAYKEAQNLDPTLEISAFSWNLLCWRGSIWGYLNGNLDNYQNDVMDACEKAVAKAGEVEPGYADFLQSRGLVRALVGDTDGSIEDFQSYLKWSEKWIVKNPWGVWGNPLEVKKYFQRLIKREKWINSLKKGKNPFTNKEMRELLDE